MNPSGPQPAYHGTVGEYNEGREMHDEHFLNQVLEVAGVNHGECIVDLGAGNGNASIPLAKRYAVIAVEPDENRLTELKDNIHLHQKAIAEGTGSINTVRSFAERIPLGAVTKPKAVIAASALHWFDPNKVLPEIARILPSNGKLIAMSRLLDPHQPIVKDLHTTLSLKCPGYKTAKTQFIASRESDVRNCAPQFMDMTKAQVKTQDDPRSFTKEGLVAYLKTVSSTSKWLQEGNPAHSQAVQAVHTFFDDALKEYGNAGSPEQPSLKLPFQYIAVIGEPNVSKEMRR